MAHINQTRLMSGPDAGRLRIMLDIRLSEGDEMALAALLGKDAVEQVRENLAQGVHSRGLGPVAEIATRMAWNGLADAVQRGHAKWRTTRKKTKKRTMRQEAPDAE